MKDYFYPSKEKIIFSVLALVLFVFPLVRLVMLSVFSEDGTLTFSQYAYFISDDRAIEAVKNTLYISITASLISAFCGVTTAFLVGYTNIHFKNIIEVLVLLPFVIPAYIITLSWTGLMGSGSWFNQMLIFCGFPPINLFSIKGIIAMLGICHMSVVHVTVVHMLRKVPLEAGWAARASGCPLWQSLWRVDLPIVLPAIAGGTVLAFLADVDNFAVPAFLGISSNITVLSTYIYEKIISFGPDSFTYGAVLSVILSLIALTGAILSRVLVPKSNALESTKENSSVRVHFPPKVRVLIEVLMVGLLTLFSIVPSIYMAISALLKGYTFTLNPTFFTLDNYLFVFNNEGVLQAALNSLFMAGIAALGCLVAGTLTAYMIVRCHSKTASILSTCASVTYSVPGIVLALAMIFYWAQPLPGIKTGLYGTYTSIILGYITRYMILQINNSSAAFMSVAAVSEQAAVISGSNKFTLWVKIIVPQLVVPALAGTFFVFLSAFSELTLSSVMSSASTKTIGLAIFNLQQAGDYSLAAALSTVIIIFISIIYCTQKFVRHFCLGGRRYESDY